MQTRAANLYLHLSQPKACTPRFRVQLPVLALSFALLLLIALPLSAKAQPASSASANATIESMAWLAGCWAALGPKAEPGSGEQWLQPAGGTMLGVSRSVRGGKTVGFEFMQLRINPEGKLVFIAQPSGKPPTTFVASAQGTRDVSFENLAHDFPQRVNYALQPDGKLAASIAGTLQGKARSIDFPMQRVPCDAVAPAAGV